MIRQRIRPREKDVAYRAATALARKRIGAGLDAMNTYKFATAVLALNHEVAHAEVKQLEADSKFFRSLVVLSMGGFVASAAASQFGSAAICLLGAAMCAWRYIERRWKATHRAFEYVVVLLGAEGNPASP